MGGDGMAGVVLKTFSVIYMYLNNYHPIYF